MISNASPRSTTPHACRMGTGGRSVVDDNVVAPEYPASTNHLSCWDISIVAVLIVNQARPFFFSVVGHDMCIDYIPRKGGSAHIWCTAVYVRTLCSGLQLLVSFFRLPCCL